VALAPTFSRTPRSWSASVNKCLRAHLCLLMSNVAPVSNWAADQEAQKHRASLLRTWLPRYEQNGPSGARAD
jgi:hypothetical protein